MWLRLLELLGLEPAPESSTWSWWWQSWWGMGSWWWTSWWRAEPPPKSHFTIFSEVVVDLVSLLWTTNLGIVTSVCAGLVVSVCLLALLTVHLSRYLRSRKGKMTSSTTGSMKSAKSTTPRSQCRKHVFRKRLKKSEINRRTAINESTETEQEMEMEKSVPLHRHRRSCNSTRKRQRNAKGDHNKSEFEKSKDALTEKGALNERAALDESTSEMPFSDHHNCPSCKDISTASLDSLTSEKQSYKKSRSVSYNSSRYSALKGDGKDCLASPDFKQQSLKQDLVRMHTSVGTNTSDQFSSEEIWRTTPSVTWTSADEQCTVMNKPADMNNSEARSKPEMKETEYSTYEYERYSISPSESRKDETIMSKITCGEDVKMANSQPSSPGPSLSYGSQITKSTYNTEASMRKTQSVNVKQEAPCCTIQHQDYYTRSPVSTPGLEAISYCISDGYSSFTHLDNQWSPDSSWTAGANVNTVLGNTHFNMYETITEVETASCMPSSRPASPTGQTSLASRSIIDEINKVPVQNDFINNSYINDIQETVLPDTEVNQMESLGVSEVKDQLPLPDISYLEEHEMYELASNADFYVYPCIQEVATLTKENVEKFELLQLQHDLQSVLPPVTEELKNTEKSQQVSGNVHQMKGLIYQTLPSPVPNLNENQITSLELNVAHMALENQWGLPYVHKVALATMLPPQSPLPKSSYLEPVIKEVETPVLTENEVYALEFNLQMRIGMHQWRPTSIKKVNSADPTNATKTKSNLKKPKRRKPTRLKLKLERKVAQDSDSLPYIEKCTEGSDALVEVKKEEFETSVINSEHLSHIEMTPAIDKVKSDEVIIEEVDAAQFDIDKVKSDEVIIEEVDAAQFDIDKVKSDEVIIEEVDAAQLNIEYLESHPERNVFQHTSYCFENEEQQFEEMSSYHLQNEVIKPETSQQTISTDELSKTEAEHTPSLAPVNDSILQNDDSTYGNISESQVNQLSKTVKKDDIPLNVENKTTLVVQASVPSDSNRKKYRRKSKRKAKVASPASSINTNKSANLKSQSLDEEQVPPSVTQAMDRKEINCFDEIRTDRAQCTKQPTTSSSHPSLLFGRSGSPDIALPIQKVQNVMSEPNIYVAEKQFEIPSGVQKSFTSVHVNKITSTDILPLNKTTPRPRPQGVPIIEQDTVDCLEMNLKQRLIPHPWEYPTSCESSMNMMTSEESLITKASDANIESTGIESSFIDDKTRDSLEWHITQKKLEHSWDSSTNFHKSTEVSIASSTKLVSSLPSLNNTAVVTTESSFITSEHETIVEMNVINRITSNEQDHPEFIQQSLDEFNVPTPLCLENVDRNDSAINNCDIPYPLNIIPHQDKMFQNERKAMVQAHGSDSGETNILREASCVTRLKPEFKNKLIMCLTKQKVEIKSNCLPNLVSESYKHSYSQTSKKYLPAPIKVGKGYKKPRPLFIPFMERDAIDRLEINLGQKLISNLCGFPTLYEESLEIMIPKAPPISPPIKTCATNIEPIGMDTVFLEDEIRNDLERHIIQIKLQLSWGIPTEIQKSRNEFIPAAPKLVCSQLNPQPCSDLVIVLTDLAFISNEHEKMLEINMKKKIINRRRGLLPKVVQRSLINFMDFSLIKDLIAHSDIAKRTKSSCSSNEHHKTLKHTKKLVLRKHKSSRKNRELRKIEFKDKLEMCVAKQCLDIKMDYLPDIVKEMYKVTYPKQSKKSLPKLIAPSRHNKKLRPHYIPFVEQDAVHRLEMNLKHKQISHLWGLETLNEMSLEMMVPQEIPLPPAIKATDAKILLTAMKTDFISNKARSILEWHITQKKLECNWGFPLHIQRSQEAFIPPPPKLILSQFNRWPDFDVKVLPTELAFLDVACNKKLDLNVKKRIINHHWGLPKLVLSSLERFMPPAPKIKSTKPQLENSGKNKVVLSSKAGTVRSKSNLLQLKGAKLSAPFSEQAVKLMKGKRKRMPSMLDSLNSEHKNQLDMCLTKQCLEIKQGNIPAIVQEFYKNTYPSTRKKPLPKLLAPGEGFKKARQSYIPFVEQDAINHLEMNLKIKHMSHLWGFQTLYEESLELMIPKAPPVFPALKAHKGQIVPVSMETTFISKEVRSNLEWHVTQKTLQHSWGIPSHYRKSLEAFIPVAPKLVPSQLSPQADSLVIITLNELPFLDVGICKALELTIRKKIINQRWGLPKFIQSSLRNFMAPAPLMNQSLIQSKTIIRKKSKASNIEIENYKTSFQQKAFVKAQRDDSSSAQCQRNRSSSKTTKLGELKPEDKNRLEVCLMKQHLEIRMDCLPEMVKSYYKNTYYSTSKKPVPQLNIPQNGFKKRRPSYMSFIEQNIVSNLELNLKHKQLNNLLGIKTLTDESMEMMIPEAPPVPPPIKAIETQIEPVGVEINFSEDEIRKDLERHITQKRLQQTWGLPFHIQRSQEAFILPAPKLVLSALNPQPDFHFVFAPSELPFINKEQKKMFELSIRKRVINRKLGLPKAILSSLSNFMVPAPSMKDLTQKTEIIKDQDLLSNSSIEKVNSEVSSSDTFQLHVGKNTFLSQYYREIKSSNQVADFKIVLKQEHLDRLAICLTKQSLQIKMHSIPEMVKEMYKNTYPAQVKKPLPKLIAPGRGFKRSRSKYISFIEQESVARLELNLKHKQIMHLWSLETPYEMSVEMQIPKGPNTFPVLESNGVQIEPVGMEVTFIDSDVRDRLEQHIIRRKLENNWGLPTHIQRSIDSFIPFAPKLVPSMLNPCHVDVVVDTTAELLLISADVRKRLEMNTKKKIINKKWGLPKLIQSSVRDFAPVPSLKGHIKQSERMKGSKTLEHTDAKSRMKVRHKKEKFPSLNCQNVYKTANLKKKSALPDFVNLEPECEDKINMCLLKQVLDIKTYYLPDIVQESYDRAYPTASKKVLPKFGVSNERCKKQRPWCLPFVEQGAINHLELNLKHRQIVHNWKLETLYDESMKMMIPKAPPLPPAIKASEAKVEPVGMESTFIELDIRDKIEWHITQKKLQQNWTLPQHIQMSAEMFIPPAPRLIPSQLNQQLSLSVVVAPTELTFLSKEHKKLLERNTKKKVINHRWGLPVLIQSSLTNFMALSLLRKDLVPQSEIREANKTGPTIISTTRKTKIHLQLHKKAMMSLQYKKNCKGTKLSKTSEMAVLSNFKQETADKLDMCLRRLHLEINLQCVPEIVKDSYKQSYPSASKKPLRKIIAPGQGCKRSRSLYIAFIEQDAVNRLELNLKHKLIYHNWGLATPTDESMEMMIAKGSPLPPAIKSSGAEIEHVGRETAFLDNKVRENFENHVIQQKLQETWGLPLNIQRSEEAFIPIAPKLIPSQLNQRPTFSIVVAPTELQFLRDEQKRILEMNIKKKIINHKWGLPKLIQLSLNKFMGTAPNVSNNIDHKENKMVLHNTFTSIRRGKFFALQNEKTSRSKKTKKTDKDLFLASFQPELKQKLEICLTKLSLDIKTGCLPEMVKEFYKNTYPPQSKKPLPKLIAPGKGIKKRRPHCLPFVEQGAIHQLELNLKHKLIAHLCKFPNLFEESVERMICKAPPVPPDIKAKNDVICPVQMETRFIEDEVRSRLEWHITQKKLQHNWGLPLLILRSQEAFIPPAPKLIPSDLKPQPGYSRIFVSSELVLSSEHQKKLERNVRKRIINNRWGLPKVVQNSLSNFMASIAQTSEAVERNKVSSTDIHVKNRKIDSSINMFLQSKKMKLPLNQSQKGNGNLKPYSAAEIYLSAKLSQESKDMLEICLTKQSLEIKNGCLPETVKEMYKATYPPKSKKPLPKPIAPGKGVKKPRLLYLPFIEQSIVNVLESNLKHKQLAHLWGFPTQYEESAAMMIPEAPPEHPAIKASGAQIEFVGKETTFLDNKIKDRLEWHIAQKKLQHNWGFPLYIQRSQENFIPPAPKLIPFHVMSEPCFVTIYTPTKVPFLSIEHQKLLELNTRKRAINCKWGLPKAVQLSLNSFIPVPPQTDGLILDSEHQTEPIPIMPTTSDSVTQLRRKFVSPNEDNSYEVFSSDNQMVICKTVIEFCLMKQCLEIKMKNLPKLVTDAYCGPYAEVQKKILPKTILPGKGFKKRRSTYMPFIEQEVVDRLELNLMHKQITHQWGFLTLYEESLEMMIPVAPPLPPRIKASGAQIEPVGMENNFIENEIRDRLELHITQKKLQYNWGLPLRIQRSLEVFIPPAPKFIPIQVNSQPDFSVVVAPSELAFLTEGHRQTLNRNIKKRIINNKWGLPKVITSSLRQFMAPTPDDKDFMQPPEHCKRRSNSSNLGKNYKVYSQSSHLRLKGGKSSSQYETDEMNLNKVKEIAMNIILRSQYKETLNISLTRQCLEIKIGCLPELVKGLYKCTYPTARKKPLSKLIAPGRGFKKPRVRYIPFMRQDDIDLIEMNLKHRQLSYLCGFETLYDKSMGMMIPKGPPLPPSIKPKGVQMEHSPQPTTAFSDGVKECLEWHILQKKLQHTWGLPSHIQKSTEAFIPPAPKLVVTQLNPQPCFEIVIAPAELEFISDEHKKALEINIKKRIINHRWGLPKLIQSSFNEFMTPPPPIWDFIQQIIIKKNCGARCRTVRLSNDCKMTSSQHASLLTKEQKSTFHHGNLKRSVKVKKKERRMPPLAVFRPEYSDKLNMCLLKQSLSIKLDCLPELVTDLYKQTYPPALKRSLPKLKTHVNGIKKTRLPYILFAEQDIIHHLDMNLKHKQINYLWGVATIFDKSMEMMIPRAPSLFPAIKPNEAKIEHKGMELAFQSTETIEILEWHIIAKYFEYQWGIPLHIQQSINKFIPTPPKLARSHFSQRRNIDISVSINELIFLTEEFKEALEININNRIINQKKGIPNFIQASLNSFIPPVPPGNDFVPCLQPGERSNTGFRRSELTKINTILSTDQIFCACTVSLANSENDNVSSCVDSLEEFSVSPKLESKNKMNADMTKQSFEIQSVYRCSYSATSKSLLKLNTPYRRLKKQNLKSKWGDDCFEVEYPIASPSYRAKSMKTVGSSTWTTDQKLADLTYKPMTIVGLSLGPAMIEANVPSSPMIVQDFNVYVKQNMGSAFLSRPVPYADCEEIFSKSSRDIDNDVPCSEELTQEEQNHIQENARHGYVKIVAGAIVNNQNEEQKAKVDLSEINCAQSTPTKLDNTLQNRIIVPSQDPDDGNYLSVSDEELHAAYCENLNKSYHTSRTYVAKKKCKKTFQNLYSSQTKPDKNLMKSKAKFSKQDCQRPRTTKHKKEGTKSELSNENILLVRPPAEPCQSETDEKEKSSSFSSNCDQAESPVSTRETSHSCRHDEGPSQSSTANSLGCQQASSHEESSFATNKDCEVYYQCESPLSSHTKQ